MARIEDDLCTLSLDTSGEPLHRRGHKQALNPAPMRETLAALFLRACGYDGREPVLDPMCGAGTFVIEAAEIAAGLMPGRSRRFAFESLATFDPSAWERMKARPAAIEPAPRFLGSDRDTGAVAMSRANAERAGVAAFTLFERAAISDLRRPDGPPGLVIVNPPYGGRIGNRKLLFALYAALGQVLRARFEGLARRAGDRRCRARARHRAGPFAGAGGAAWRAEGAALANGPPRRGPLTFSRTA
jgi:putative N6-adenine-specific DNA methylase